MEPFTTFMMLVQQYGFPVAVMLVVVWAWLTGQVVSKATHDTIVVLYKEKVVAADKSTEDAWRAFDAIAPQAERSQEIASRALETHTRRASR